MMRVVVDTNILVSFAILKRLRKNPSSAGKFPSGAEARNNFDGLAARVELVPFPTPRETEFFNGLLMRGRETPAIAQPHEY
jgi:hypothetical protein